MDPEDIADVLFWDAKGLTQQEIAAKFTPAKHQSSISRCLRKWGPDRTPQAKRMISAASPRLVLEILSSHDTKAKVALLKGTVLDGAASAHYTTIINGLTFHGLGQQAAIEGEVV